MRGLASPQLGSRGPGPPHLGLSWPGLTLRGLEPPLKGAAREERAEDRQRADMPTGSGVEPDAVWDHPPLGGPRSSSEKGMTSPARPGQGPMGTNGWKTGPLWPAGSSSDQGTGQQEKQDCQEPCRCHLCPPQRGPPPEPGPSPACWSALPAGGPRRGHVQGQWRVEEAAPAARAVGLCRHTVTPGRSSSQGPARGGLCSGAACLCPKPHRSPVADQDPLPNLRPQPWL